MAKLIAGLATWFLGAVILAISALITFGGPGPEGPDPVQLLAFPLLPCLLISLHIFIGILPLCLSGRIPGFPWSLLPLLLLVGGVFTGFSWWWGLLITIPPFFSWWWGTGAGELGLLLYGLAPLGVLKLGVACWAFWRSLRLRLVSPAFVGGYLAFWLAGTGLVAFGLCRVMNFWHVFPSVVVWIPVAGLAVPLARIALSPLALALNRHR